LAQGFKFIQLTVVLPTLTVVLHYFWSMAVVVRNTFLDIADHKFLCFDEPCNTKRRCHSLPATWKPVMPDKPCMPLARSKKRTLSLVSNSSTQSDLSCCSSMASLETFVSCEDVKETCASTSPTETKDDNNVRTAGTITKLKSASPAFQPMPLIDTRLDAVTNAIYLALVSCGQICHVSVEKSFGQPTSISAQLRSGSRTCYDAIHLARQSLEEITKRLGAVSLLSKRVQKEERGYSLRSSVACIPAEMEDMMCWDFFNKGNCPRRCKCQWYHPQDSDIGRFKVTVKALEEVLEVSTAEQAQFPASHPVVRHKISLGELVL